MKWFLLWTRCDTLQIGCDDLAHHEELVGLCSLGEQLARTQGNRLYTCAAVERLEWDLEEMIREKAGDILRPKSLTTKLSCFRMQNSQFFGPNW